MANKMFIWDCTWGSHKAEVTAKTAIGARKKARKAWGRTVRRPEDHEIEVFIRRLPDGTPIKPVESAADKVAQRVYTMPTPPCQQEDW